MGVMSSGLSLQVVGTPRPPHCLPAQVFHKIITSGHQRLQPLFDCLLTIVVNGRRAGSPLPHAHHQVVPDHTRLTCRGLVPTCLIL